MRSLPLLLLLTVSAACRVEPPPSEATNPGKPPRASVQIFLVYEMVGAGIEQRKIESTGEIVLLARQPDLTERDVSWAKLLTDPGSLRPAVLVHFTPSGSDKLELLTRQNVGKRLAIVVEGKILSAPLIRTAIRDGRATIQGFRSVQEAQRVADALAWR